jgi:type I restriction enzyme S subunit
MSGRYKAYEEYKDSGVEWLGEVPEGWNIFSIRRALTGCTNGIWGSEPNGKGDMIVLRVADFERNSFLISDEKLTKRQISQRERFGRLLKRGDLLLEKSGGGDKTLVGCVVLFDKKYSAVTSNFVAKMSPLKGYSSKFLTFCFSQLYAGKVNYPSIKQTTGIQNLDSDAYLMEKFSFPSYEEQTQIANFLDHETAKIDTLIDKQQQLIELLKEKRQAVISHAVTKGLDPDVPMKDSGVEWLGKIPEYWHINKMRYMFSFGKGLTITKENLMDEGIPCVNYGEVHSKFSFEVDPGKHFLKCVNSQYLITSPNSLLNKGDLVFADTSEDIEGSGNFTHLISDDALFAGYHTIIARPHESKNSRFYAYLFDCSQLRSQIKYSVKGVKVFSITQAILRAINIWLPSPEEQTQIANFLDHETAKIDKLIDLQLQQIELLKERRTALISAAVTGKIDVRDWQVPVTQTESDEVMA